MHALQLVVVAVFKAYVQQTIRSNYYCGPLAANHTTVFDKYWSV